MATPDPKLADYGRDCLEGDRPMRAPTSMLPGTRPDWGPDGEPVWQPPRTENARRGWRNALFIAVALIVGLLAVGTTKVDKSKLTAAEASATVANQRADNAVGVARQQSDA